MTYKCPLGKLIPDTPDTDKLKRDAWELHNILVVSLDHEKLDWSDKIFLQRIGNRIYKEKK